MMRVVVVVLGLLAGCASSSEIRSVAEVHERKAAGLEAQGDYERAAKEREAADKQLRKADRRAWHETYGYYY
jgi:hypothetical protein